MLRNLLRMDNLFFFCLDSIITTNCVFMVSKNSMFHAVRYRIIGNLILSFQKLYQECSQDCLSNTEILHNVYTNLVIS